MSHFACLVAGENITDQMYPYRDDFYDYKDSADFYWLKHDYYTKYTSNPPLTLEEYVVKFFDFTLVKKYEDGDPNGNFAVVNANGEIDEFYANKKIRPKYDNYGIGGRYSGSLYLKNSENLLTFYVRKKGNTGSGTYITRLSSSHSLVFQEDDNIWLPVPNKEVKKGNIIKEDDIEYNVFDVQKYGLDSALKIDIDWERTGPFFAILIDGKWYDREDDKKYKDDNVWKERFFQLINPLPDNTLLTLVDCHI